MLSEGGMMLDDETLEAVAVFLERRASNEMYKKAWKAAAKLIRGLKKLPDNPTQISSSSS